jgi:hypothetical protein
MFHPLEEAPKMLGNTGCLGLVYQGLCLKHVVQLGG